MKCASGSHPDLSQVWASAYMLDWQAVQVVSSDLRLSAVPAKLPAAQHRVAVHHKYQPATSGQAMRGMLGRPAPRNASSLACSTLQDTSAEP